MTTYEVVRLLVWIIGLPIIAYLLWRIIQRVREINARDAELRAEEEANAQNPYFAMARMYEAEQLLEEARKGKKRSSSKPTSDS